MKKILLVLVLGVLMGFPVYTVKAVEAFNVALSGRTSPIVVSVTTIDVVEEDEDYLEISLALSNDWYALDCTGIKIVIPFVSSMNFRDLGYIDGHGVNVYSEISLYNRDTGLLARTEFNKYVGADLNLFPDTFEIIVPFSKFLGLSATDFDNVSEVEIRLYTESDLADFPNFEEDFSTAVSALFTLYSGNFDGEDFIVYWYGQTGVIFEITNYYTRNFKTKLYAPQDTVNDIFLGWKTYTGRTYNFNGIILEDELIEMNGDIVFPLYPIIASTVPVDIEENEVQAGVLTEFLAIFNLDNEWGFMLLYLLLTVVGVGLFLFKKWAFMGLVWPHMILTVLFWIFGFIKIYLVIPMFLLYVSIFIMNLKTKGDINNG